MFRPIFNFVAHLHGWLQAYAPTNRLIARLRTRRGLKWGVPAMLVGVAYWYAAAICDAIIDRGGPGWLNLLIALFMWNGLKFLVIGPVSLILLAHARWTEWRTSTGRPPRTRKERPRYAFSHLADDSRGEEKQCSGMADHSPTHDCFTNGRCLAAWAAIESWKRSNESGWS